MLRGIQLKLEDSARTGQARGLIQEGAGKQGEKGLRLQGYEASFTSQT